MPDQSVSASGPAWICTSCGEAVEYVEPPRRPRIFVEVTGRATLEMDGSVLHQCVPGSYAASTNALFARHGKTGPSSGTNTS